MRLYPLLFLLLTGLVSACNFGSYPSGGSQSPSGGQQYPDDTYPGSPSGGNQPPSRYPSGGDQSPSRYPSGGDQSPSQYPPSNYPPSPGRSRSADPGVVVNDIRLTRDYTILNLTYTNKNRVQRNQRGQVLDNGKMSIEFDQAGQLIAANGARKFNFIRAEGVPIKSGQNQYNARGQRIPQGIATFPGQQVTFTLYFERLDKGLENFDLFECITSDQFICWNIYNLFVDNPADSIVYTPTPVPPKPSRPLPQPSGQSGGETRAEPVPKPVPAPATLAVTGIVSDAKTRRPVTATINYQLSASKKSVDSVQSFASTGVYRLTLLRGQIYTYIASARGYQSANGVVDVSKVTGSQTITRNIELTPLAVGDKITLKNVYFEMSKSDLLSASYAELDKLVAMMHDNPNMTIRLEGHTDIIGDHAKNLQLSQDRVLACERYLVQKGIDTDRIQTIGYGDTRPITTKGTDEDRKINRRVEFDILTL